MRQRFQLWIWRNGAQGLDAPGFFETVHYRGHTFCRVSYVLPWSVEEIASGYVVKAANGFCLAYIYQPAMGDADVAKGITLDEARRIARNRQSIRAAQS